MDDHLASLKNITDQGSCIKDRPTTDNTRTIRYVICPDLIIESANDRHITLCNRETAARFRLSQAAYRFLNRFRNPCQIDSIATEMPDQLAKPIRHFIEKGLLVDADAPCTDPTPKLRRTMAIKFCNAPALDRSMPPADFVILGMPYDCGGSLECRMTPASIREKSLDYTYEADLKSGRPRGWMDVNAGHRILEGATIQDAGDMRINFGESAENFLSRCSATLKEVVRSPSCPVILGGDQSISHPIVAHLQQNTPLTVLQITPDPRQSKIRDADLAHPIERHRKILSLKNVVDIVCFTGESFLSLCITDERKTQSTQSKTHWLTQSEGDFMTALDQNCALYISIDMTLFTSPHEPAADDSAVPGLSQLRPVQHMLKRIGANHKIAGIDIVGLDSHCAPRHVFPVVACHLLLGAMHIAHMRKGTGHA